MPGAAGLTHNKVSGVADTGDTTLVQPQADWNDQHYFAGGNLGALLYQGTSGLVTEIDSVASGQVLVSAGAGSVPAWSASPSLTSILLGNGTAGAPAIAGTNFTTTGPFWSSGPTYNVAVAGATRLSITAAELRSLVPFIYQYSGANDYVQVNTAGTVSGNTNSVGLKWQLITADGASGLRLSSASPVSFNSTTDLSGGALDVVLSRLAADSLGLAVSDRFLGGAVISPLATVTTTTTAGAVTYAAAELLGGVILRNPNGAARADLVPTAANLLAGLAGARVGQAFEFTIRNTATAAETITVTTNTGVTLSGTMTIAQNNSKRFLAVFTNVTAASEAYTLYSLGSVVH